MENVIKNMNIKTMLDRAEYERVTPPANGESVNIQITDEITVKLLSDEIARVTIARSAVSNPERLFKLYVEMSADVLVDKKYYDQLANPAEYFKKTPICRAIVSQIALFIANMTTNSPIGPMITAPMLQA